MVKPYTKLCGNIGFNDKNTEWTKKTRYSVRLIFSRRIHMDVMNERDGEKNVIVWCDINWYQRHYELKVFILFKAAGKQPIFDANSMNLFEWCQEKEATTNDRTIKRTYSLEFWPLIDFLSTKKHINWKRIIDFKFWASNFYAIFVCSVVRCSMFTYSVLQYFY